MEGRSKVRLLAEFKESWNRGTLDLAKKKSLSRRGQIYF